jgi:uncharacterized coiled-coil protein SlyX
VRAMTIPATVMDPEINKRIDKLEEQVAKIRNLVVHLGNQNKVIEEKIEDDIHDHVRTLVDRIHILESEIKSLK